MIPRLLAEQARTDERAPFELAVSGGRQLCFFLDPAHIDEGEARRALLAHAAAGTITTFATGPVDGAHILKLPAVPADYVPRHPLEDVLSGAWHDTNGSNGIFAVMGLKNALTVGAARALELRLSPEAARRLVILSAAAEQYRGCDGLVSDNDDVRTLAPARTSIFRADEAVSLIGLQARLRGDFSLGPDMGPFSRWLFYWVLARELLPAGWRWFSACLKSSQAAGGDPDIGDLGGAAITRLDRALRSRDRFHGEAKQPQPRTSADEALFHFETTLLYLSAAFDVAARVAARAYAMDDRPRPSWRSQNWLNALRLRDPHLAGLMEPATAGRDALEVVQLLRNTIHGEAIRGVEHQGLGGERRSLLEVPKTELKKLMPVLERRGGGERWGLVEQGGRSYVDAQIYLESVMADAAPCLNALLEGTDVTLLPGVGAADVGGPPANVPSGLPVHRLDPFSFEIRRRVRVLAGFGEIND